MHANESYENDYRISVGRNCDTDDTPAGSEFGTSRFAMRVTKTRLPVVKSIADAGSTSIAKGREVLTRINVNSP